MINFKQRTLLQIVGESCKTWRITNDFSQGQVAQELGVSQSSVTTFESGNIDSFKYLMWYVGHGFDTSRGFLNPHDYFGSKISFQEVVRYCNGLTEPEEHDAND